MSVSNQFPTAPSRVEIAALANVEQQRAIAEVQARMMIARAHPRDPRECLDNILRQCTRPGLAKTALYAYARGGAEITGPSIRLAEAIAQSWGNIASGIKEISRIGGYSECVAYAWDLETGYYDERQFQVRHWRDTRQGGHALTDERDIYELIANMGQRRKRAVLLTVIPGDVVEAAVDQCEQTLKAVADTSPDAIQRMVKAFQQFGVTKEQIEARIQRRIESILPAQVLQLSKIYSSLQDEMSSPQDWFEDPTKKRGEGVRSAFGLAGEAKPELETKGPTVSNPFEPATTRVNRAVREMQDRKTAPAASQEAQDGAKAAEATTATPSTGLAQATATETAAGYWLVDPAGEPLEEMFADPVSYMRAAAALKAKTDPEEWAALEQANDEDINRAALADAEAAKIYREVIAEKPSRFYREAAPGEQQEEGVKSESGTTQSPNGENQQEEVDPMMVILTSADTAGWKQYHADAKARLGQCTSPAMVLHFATINNPTITNLPGKWRSSVFALIQLRKTHFNPPPQQNEQASEDPGPKILADLKRDIMAYTSGDDLRIMDRNAAVMHRMEALQRCDNGDELIAELRRFAKNRLAELEQGS